MEKIHIVHSTRSAGGVHLQNLVAFSAMLAVGVIAIAPTNAMARSRQHSEFVSGQSFNESMKTTETRISRFKTALRLTPDQEKNWQPVETAMQEMGQNRVARIAKMHEQKVEALKTPGSRLTTPKGGVVASDRGWTGLDELQAQVDERAASIDDMSKFLHVSETLYGVLDAAQQRRFDILIKDLFHRELNRNSRI